MRWEDGSAREPDGRHDRGLLAGVETLCAAHPTVAGRLRKAARAREQEKADLRRTLPTPPPPPPDPDAVPTHIGPYRIFERIDKGGMARTRKGIAQENAATAQRNAADATARKAEFDQLAGVVRYDRAIEAEKKHDLVGHAAPADQTQHAGRDAPRQVARTQAPRHHAQA